MKRIVSWFCLAGMLACSESDNEVFYTTNYPIERIEASATLAAGETTLTQEQLQEEVLAMAPVKVGGNYRLDFNRFDGGALFVTTESGTTPLVGSFTKTPGTRVLIFAYETITDTAQISSWQSEEGANLVKLTIDLTNRYKELYPDAEIEKVLREEFTTKPY